MGDVWERLLKERGYKIQHTLGEGAYSKVKSAFSSRLGRDVAIKCINTQMAPTDFVEKFLPRELKTLPLLRHENIVRVYEILEASDGYVYIVMEAARNGDMLRYIQRKGALPEPEIRHYFYQLVQAVSYCHSQNICHRDLKCENLLLDKDFKLLLTDFGFSKSMIFEPNDRVVLSNTFCGSAAYAAPEIIQGQSYDPRMHDMWSMGVILYIMSCGHMPFDDSNVKKMLRVQLRNHLKFPPRVQHLLSEDLKSLIRSLIEPNVSQRATMEMVKQHPFLSGEGGRSSRLDKPASTQSVAKQIVDFFTGGQQQGGSGGQSSHPQEHDSRRRNTVPSTENPSHQSQGGSSQAHRRHHHRNRGQQQQQQQQQQDDESGGGGGRSQGGSRHNQAPRHSCRAKSPPQHKEFCLNQSRKSHHKTKSNHQPRVDRSRSAVESTASRQHVSKAKRGRVGSWLAPYYGEDKDHHHHRKVSIKSGDSDDDDEEEACTSSGWKSKSKWNSLRNVHKVSTSKKRLKKEILMKNDDD